MKLIINSDGSQVLEGTPEELAQYLELQKKDVAPVEPLEIDWKKYVRPYTICSYCGCQKCICSEQWYKDLTKRSMCPAHNGQPWSGIIPPKCTCPNQYIYTTCTDRT
jgi:hypothetical protein